MNYLSIEDTIGNTPLVRFAASTTGESVRLRNNIVLGKLEK